MHPRTLFLIAILFVSQTMFGNAAGWSGEPIVLADTQVILIDDMVLVAPIAGKVNRVRAFEGQPVAAGDVVVELDDRRAQAEWTASMAVAEAARLQSENDVNIRYAQRTFEVRRRELEQSNEANQRYAGSVTATDIDRMRLVIDQAELSIEQAVQEREVASAAASEKEALVELARLRCNDHRIVAPFAGRLAETSVSTGQWVEAGSPLVRLISLDPIRVSGFVDGRRFDRSLIGRSVTFQWPNQSDVTGDAPELKTLKGTVTFVSDELNPVTSQVRLWARIDNPNQDARPGMRGTLTIASDDMQTLPAPQAGTQEAGTQEAGTQEAGTQD